MFIHTNNYYTILKEMCFYRCGVSFCLPGDKTPRCVASYRLSYIVMYGKEYSLFVAFFLVYTIGVSPEGRQSITQARKKECDIM